MKRLMSLIILLFTVGLFFACEEQVTKMHVFVEGGVAMEAIINDASKIDGLEKQGFIKGPVPGVSVPGVFVYYFDYPEEAKIQDGIESAVVYFPESYGELEAQIFASSIGGELKSR